MKVAFVTMSFPAPSETFASNDVRRVAAMGADVSVHALLRAQPHTLRLIEERGLDVVQITYPSAAATWVAATRVAWQAPRVALSVLGTILRTCAFRPAHLFKSMFLFPRILEIFGVLLRDRPDVVHALWGHYPAIVLDFVQRHLPDAVTSISFSVYDIRYRFPISRRVAHRADVVRSLSRVTARETAAAYGLPLDRIVVIHDSVDLGLLPTATPRVPRRVLTAARLVKKKGVDLVLGVFADAHRTYPDATLHILGDGPERQELQDLAVTLGVAEAVTFTGHVSQTQVLSEMLEAEVFLFLSLTERLPNAVKEAMACGCLCVVSRTIGIDEMINDGVSGFIVEQGDVETARRRVLDTFASRVETGSMTTAAAAWIRQEFALDANVDRYLWLWRDALRRRPLVGDAADGVNDRPPLG